MRSRIIFHRKKVDFCPRLHYLCSYFSFEATLYKILPINTFGKYISRGQTI